MFWCNLLELLGKRMKVADEIGLVKKEANVRYCKTNVGMKFWKMILEGEKDYWRVCS
jgi:chorismate mutase